MNFKALSKALFKTIFKRKSLRTMFLVALFSISVHVNFNFNGSNSTHLNHRGYFHKITLVIKSSCRVTILIKIRNQEHYYFQRATDPVPKPTLTIIILEVDSQPLTYINAEKIFVTIQEAPVEVPGNVTGTEQFTVVDPSRKIEF